MSSISTKSTKDLRVRRTRKWLQEALLQLMKEKPYSEIQITEVADRAQVSRPTFYLHYRSKEELLLSLLDMLFAEFYTDLAQATAAGDYTKLNLCTQLFIYWERHADMLKLITQAGIQNEIIERLRLFFRQVMLHLKEQTGKPVAEGEVLELVVSFMSGGIYMLLAQWGLQNLPFSAEQMGHLLNDLTASHEDITLSL